MGTLIGEKYQQNWRLNVRGSGYGAAGRADTPYGRGATALVRKACVQEGRVPDSVFDQLRGGSFLNAR